MLESSYYMDGDIDDIVFPDVVKRKIFHGVRTMKSISEWIGIIDANTERTFSIPKESYHLVKHEEVIKELDALCAEFPEYGVPTREIWLDNFGGRMRTRWTFKDVDFTIGSLPNGKPDIVHPTMETFSSYDTSLAQRLLVGGFRMVCSNGQVIGKTLASYKHKHSTNLSLTIARNVLTEGMENYSKVVDLWKSYMERDASNKELFCYETIGFNKDERLDIEMQIKRDGNVANWDDDDPDTRDVDLNCWDLFNILTAQSSHRVKDVRRQTKINDNLSKIFV